MSVQRFSTAVSAAASDVRAAIGNAAARTGVDFSYLMAQAKSESGLNPNAKAQSSTASGLYQFLDQSWLAIVKRHGDEHGFGWAADAIRPRAGGGFTVDPSMRQQVMGLREQAGPSSLMAASYAADNARGLGQTLGREACSTDLYFAHFLGLDGAKRFLRARDASPQACAASLFPREAGANRSIFYASDGSARSLDAVYNLMGKKLANAGASTDGPAALPGSLVPIPPGESLPQLRYALFDGSDTATGDGDGAAPDVADMLQQIERTRIDMLRPTPAQAKLAYLMLSSTPIS